MRIEETEFGRLPNGSLVRLFRATGRGGLEATVMTYGATLVSVRFPDKKGTPGEITLGFDTLEGYLGDHPYFGATIGRYANRIGHAGFNLEGKHYSLAANDESHHLHGGIVGFNRVLWNATIDADSETARIALSHVSSAGHEGYPGTLAVTVTYIITDDNLLRIEYLANTDAPTPINLTNHTYWNLETPGTCVRDHLLTLRADSILQVNKELIPSGEILPVAGTPYDFRSEKPLRDDFEAAGGYDDNFVLQGKVGELREAAVVVAPESGRRMTVRTDQPAIQLYTTNKLSSISGRGGIVFKQYGALCLEAGAYNDAVNHPSFPSTLLRPGEKYVQVTEHEFSFA